jgi:hypothetical protein
LGTRVGVGVIVGVGVGVGLGVGVEVGSGVPGPQAESIANTTASSPIRGMGLIVSRHAALECIDARIPVHFRKAATCTAAAARRHCEPPQVAAAILPCQKLVEIATTRRASQ